MTTRKRTHRRRPRSRRLRRPQGHPTSRATTGHPSAIDCSLLLPRSRPRPPTARATAPRSAPALPRGKSSQDSALFRRAHRAFGRRPCTLAAPTLLRPANVPLLAWLMATPTLPPSPLPEGLWRNPRPAERSAPLRRPTANPHMVRGRGGRSPTHPCPRRGYSSPRARRAPPAHMGPARFTLAGEAVTSGLASEQIAGQRSPASSTAPPLPHRCHLSPQPRPALPPAPSHHAIALLGPNAPTAWTAPRWALSASPPPDREPPSGSRSRRPQPHPPLSPARPLKPPAPAAPCR